MSDNLITPATFGSALAPPVIRIGKCACRPHTSPHDTPPGVLFEMPGPVQTKSDALTTTQAADYLGISPRTLEDWRARGGGPVFRKIGRRIVRYQRSDLDAFVESSARVNTGGGRPR